MNKEILLSNLLEPGTMFKVTDDFKDNTFSPGSIGFISFVNGVDESYQDVAKVLVVITRRGKGGKSRLMSANICIPIFTVDHKGFRKLLPDNGARKYFMHIEQHAPFAIDVMSLTPLAFLGYGTAISKRIKHMSDQCRHRKWPESKSNPINVLKRLPDYFEEDPEGMLAKYANDDFRETFIAEARRLTSSLVRVHLQLEIIRTKTELNAAEFLAFTNKGEFIPKDAEDKVNEYEFTNDNALLKRTVAFYTKMRDEIQKLYDNKKR